MYRRKRSGLRALLFLGITLAAILLGSALLGYLWNGILPDLFHVPVLSYGQAIGLFLLARILFGSWGPGSWRGGRGGPAGHWKSYWGDRWAAMSPEEREKFRGDWNRCRPERKESKDSGESPTPHPAN